MKSNALYPKYLWLAFFCFCNSISHSQTGIWKPFKLLIIRPDTAMVDSRFKSEKDTIQAQNLRNYYSQIKQMQEMLDFKDYPKSMDSSFKEEKASIEKQLPFLKAQEENVKKFKYFQTISQYSTEIYNFYFNEYAPFSIIHEIPWQDTTLQALKMLADTSKADYVVYYSNIQSAESGGFPILKLTTSLYSAKDGTVIMRKQTEGDINSRGDRWACSSELLCMLINCVRTSTDAVTEILYQRQIDKSKVTHNQSQP